MEFVAYQTADELLLSDIKQEIPDEDELAFGDAGETSTSVVGTLHAAASSLVDAEVYPRDSEDKIVDMKPVMWTEDGTQMFADDFLVLPTAKPFPVSDSKQPVEKTVRSRIRGAVQEKPRQYACNLCDADFGRMYSLQLHVVDKHKRRDTSLPAYRCSVCSNVQHEAGDLENHLLSHVKVNLSMKVRKPINGEGRSGSRNRPLQRCKVCGKHVADLYKHGLTHSGKRARPQSCEVCGKVVNDMYKHRKVHQGMRRKQEHQTCEICGDGVADLSIHMTSHREMYPDLQSCESDGKSVSDLGRKLQTDEEVKSEISEKSVGTAENGTEESSKSQICKVCGAAVVDLPAHLRTHQKTARRSKHQPCDVCGKVVADLYKHRKTHSKQTPSCKSCDICGKWVMDLYRHRRVHSGKASQSRMCNVCGKSIVDMYKHMLMHQGVKRPLRLCTICGKSVTDLRRHRLKIHEGVPRGQQACDVCGKMVANLRSHQLTHNEHRPGHRCMHCDRYYATAHSLKDHLRRHLTQKTFVCANCGKRFSSKEALSTHMWSHSVKPRFTCSVCDKAFRWYVTWKRHLWMHGISTGQSHICPVCSKYFATPYQLRDHMRIHSGDRPYMCWQCGRQFSHKSTLSVHVKCRHSDLSKSECPECGKAVRTLHMTDHMRNMHRHILHRCPQCHLEFRQEDWRDWHMLIHAGPQPFVCDDCGDTKDDVMDTSSSSAAHNTSLSEVSVSCVKHEHNKSPEICSDSEPLPSSDDITGHEKNSPSRESRQLPSDNSSVQQDGSISQMSADGNSSSVAITDQTALAPKNPDEVTDGDRYISAEEFSIPSAEFNGPSVENEVRCLRCNKPAPPQQCPVCHCMYPFVAGHIGVHSIRKRSFPAFLSNNKESANTTPVLSASEGGPSEKSRMCSDCGDILPSAKLLRKHMTSKTCLKFAVCIICGTTCENHSDLQLHMKTHPAEERCGSGVLDRKKRDDISCAACEVEFDSIELLFIHMDNHMDMDQCVCRICSKTFIHVNGLKFHMRGHMGKMAFQCETCGKSCRTRKNLKEHREVHLSEKPYVCTACGKLFRLRKTYLRHRVTHGGQKNYECDYCGMRFWFNYQRTRHVLVHTGQKPYICPACGERFSQWNGLSQHRLRSCRK